MLGTGRSGDSRARAHAAACLEASSSGTHHPKVQAVHVAARCWAQHGAAALTCGVADLAPALARDAHCDVVARRGVEGGVGALEHILLVAIPLGNIQLRRITVVVQEPAWLAAAAVAPPTAPPPSAPPARRRWARWRQRTARARRTALPGQAGRPAKTPASGCDPTACPPTLSTPYLRVRSSQWSLSSATTCVQQACGAGGKCRAARLVCDALLGCGCRLRAKFRSAYAKPFGAHATLPWFV